MEDKNQIKKELAEVCQKIANIPFKISKSKEDKACETKLWNRKRALLAQLNPINREKKYGEV